MELIQKQFAYEGLDIAPSCHASTILKLGEGRFLCAWFAGSRESASDVGIWHALFENGRWLPAERVPAKEQVPHWNPVLFCKKDGTICLFYKIGPNCSDWHTMLTTSPDGITWTEPRELIENDISGGRGPVKNKPIYTSDGSLLAPASTEKGQWRPFIDIYEGNGSWRKVAIPTDDGINMIQPTLWESEKGCISALMRTNKEKIYRSDSLDGGNSWCRAYPTEMPNNNSGIDCVRLEDGRLVLVCNPSAPRIRTPLTVFVSHDNGLTFTKALDLETQPGEYSYPAVITDGEYIYVTYTWKRQKIAFCQIKIH